MNTHTHAGEGMCSLVRHTQRRGPSGKDLFSVWYKAYYCSQFVLSKLYCSNDENILCYHCHYYFYNNFVQYSHREAVFKCLHLIEVLCDRLQVYTAHTGRWSFLFNYSWTLHTTLMFCTVVAIFFIL